MGLDITAYRQLVKVADPQLDECGCPTDDSWLAHASSIKWAEEHFPGRSEGVEPGAVYLYAEAFEFSAGSYSGYGWWRDTLAELAGTKERSSSVGAFAELINFADNEGVIGPVVAAKLANDFATHEQDFETRAPDGFMERYRMWRKAFEMAANGGAVEFH